MEVPSSNRALPLIHCDLENSLPPSVRLSPYLRGEGAESCLDIAAVQMCNKSGYDWGVRYLVILVLKNPFILKDKLCCCFF